MAAGRLGLFHGRILVCGLNRVDGRALMPPRASSLVSAGASWLGALGALASEIDAEDVPTRLLHLLGSLIRHDMAMVCRYVEEAPPDFLVCEGVAPHLVELYRAGLWRYDPFYEFWRRHCEGGLATLREILPPAERRGYYRRVFHRRQAQIDDELGLFMPREESGAIALFLERSKGRFSAGEKALALAVAPALTGLYRAHLRASGGRSAPATADGGSHADPNAIAALTRQAIEDSNVALTGREKEIVALVLEGYPTLAIARRLGIGRGTLKNHRRRIYRKLDITSERELFVIFLGRARAR